MTNAFETFTDSHSTDSLNIWKTLEWLMFVCLKLEMLAYPNESE